MENKEDVNLKDETLDLSSEVEENKEVKSEEKTVPLQALQEERRKRQELEQRLSALEANLKPSNANESSDPDLDIAVERLEPYLRRKGFMTKDQFEEEKSANQYAEELKNLSSKYDGKDGRPAFDAYEVAEFSKRTHIYNLEAAYEQMHKKELLDWTIKKGGAGEDVIETEKGGSSYKEKGNTPILSREALAQKLNSPQGRAWWEKNREKVIAEMEKGNIS